MANTNKSPRIWSRFEATRDGSVVKLRIEDLPPGRQDEVFDFLMTHFIGQEAFHAAAGLHLTEESKNEYRELLKYFYEHNLCHIVYCCVDDGDSKGEIIGSSVVQLFRKPDKLEEILQQAKIQIQTPAMGNLFNLVKVLEGLAGTRNFEKYFDGRGVTVHSDYRRLGIANEFLRVRKIICVEQKVPISSAWMTAFGTQKAAEKSGWKTLVEITPEELGKISGLKFETEVPTFKLMYTSIQD